jgi:hypothetical protein
MFFRLKMKLKRHFDTTEVLEAELQAVLNALTQESFRHIPAIATKSFLLMLLYLYVSQHVSAPTGHPQVNTIYYFCF